MLAIRLYGILVVVESRKTMKLRDYQAQMLAEGQDAIAQGHTNILNVLPTGGGKSPLVARIMLDAIKEGKRTLFLVHRKNLVYQIRYHLFNLGIVDCGYFLGDRRYKPNPRYLAQLGTVQSFASYKGEIDIDTVVIDECHHVVSKQWSSALEKANARFVHGFTATPLLLNGGGLGDYFDYMVQGPQTYSLIARGYLNTYRLFNVNNPDLQGVKTNGDYVMSSLSRRMQQPELLEEIIDTYLDKVMTVRGHRPTICFAVDIAHSKAICEMFRSRAGINALHIDGTMSYQQIIDILVEFASGRAPILSNVQLFDEGFDLATFMELDSRLRVLPRVAIQNVILARPTKSLRVYLQQIGRALRLNELGEPTFIFDHAGNSLPDHHGRPDDFREWTLKPAKPQGKKKIKDAKECPSCGDLVPMKERFCPSCNWEFRRIISDRAEARQDLHEQCLRPLSRFREDLGRMNVILAVHNLEKMHPNVFELVEAGKIINYSLDWALEAHARYSEWDLDAKEERRLARLAGIPVDELRAKVALHYSRKKSA